MVRGEPSVYALLCSEMDTSTPPEPTGNIDWGASPSHLGGRIPMTVWDELGSWLD